MAQQFIAQVAPTLATLAATLLCGLLSYLTTLLASKLKSDRAKSILERLDHLAEDVVLEANQTAVDKIKAASVSGQLDRETAYQIRDEVLEKLKAHITPAGLEAAKKQLGLPDQKALDLLLKTKIEAWVSTLKEPPASPNASR